MAAWLPVLQLGKKWQKWDGGSSGLGCGEAGVKEDDIEDYGI